VLVDSYSSSEEQQELESSL
jgi:hypothetical protein